MNVLYLVHYEPKFPGAVEAWAADHHHTLSYCKAFLPNATYPTLQDFDYLVISGGSQSPLEMDKYPYLLSEINFIKQAIAAGKIVFGICLGAQLIAESLGAKTKRSPNPETGIFPITLTAEARRDFILANLPQSFEVLHLHNDMSTIPDNGILLANSEGCPVQAFKYNDRVYGFQFHMEITNQSMQDIALTMDNKNGKFIQPAEVILKYDLTPLNQQLIIMLERLVARNTKIA